MPQIEVIGPVNGVYHLGYQIGNKFFSINEFVSKALAIAAASRIASIKV